MFWAYNTTSPQIDIILCKEDLTLHELLDQENVLQELKAQNLKLIEFLIKPDVLRELVSLIITEPSSDSDLSEQYRYPNLACELLTSDLPALNERLASEEILNKLYQFLQNEPPLNPLLSSYFSRTLSILISRKSEQNWFSYQYTCLQALEFLKAKEEFIQLLLRHMGTSSIMDLMLNLITLIEGPELKQSLWNWLQNQDVIPSLVSLLGPYSNPDCQTNAAVLLSSIIQKLRENLVELNDRSVLDPILHLLESAKVMELLLNTVFGADELCDTSIQSGVDVLLVLLQPYLPGDARCRLTLNYSVHDKLDSGLVIPNNNNNNKINNNNCNSAGGNKRSNCTINVEDSNNRLFVLPSEMITVVLPFIEKFKNILMNPIKKEAIQLTNGIISPPFGKARLLVAKLIGTLISLNSSEINEEIERCDIPELLLDLFYAYSSNNFLHTEVEKLIAHVIDLVNEEYPNNECKNDLFAAHLFKKCKLIERILDIWQENLERENEGHSRRGYMGHVIRIATLIHNEMRKNSVFNESVTEETPSEVLTRWNTFISDDLTAIIEKHSTCLGGIRPKLCQSSDNSFEESVSNKDSRSEMKDFGQEDDQNMMFTNDSSLMDYGEGFRFSNGLTEEEEECLEQQTKMFDLMCKQKWPSFTKGLENIEGNDEDNESNQRYGWGEVHWGSDEENVEEDTLNDSDPWSKLGNVSDPWATSTSNEASDDSWNSSDAASNWAKFDENFSEAFSANSTSSGEGLSGTCPELNATTIEQYELFSGAGEDTAFQNMDILSNFVANVKITSAALDRIESPTAPGENVADLGNEGSNWVLASNEGENENGSKNYDAMQGKYNCFQQQNNAMWNLASICGNTLAEKLANAENDIRNQDEEEQQHQQQQHQHHHRPQNDRLMNSFVEKNEQTSSSCNSSECDIRPNCDGTLEEERLLREQNAAHYLSPPDCLTENSYDFYTAENSTSDAESSVEFGDAENSFELEEEEDSMTEPSNLSSSNELSESSIEPDTRDGRESLAGDRDFGCGENVSMSEDALNDEVKQEIEEEEDDDSIPSTEMDASKDEENNAKINSKLYNSMNGVDEHSELKDHDEIKETLNSNNCDPSNDRVDASIVTEDPV